MQKISIVIVFITIVALIIGGTYLLETVQSANGFQESNSHFTVGTEVTYLHFMENYAGHDSWIEIYRPDGTLYRDYDWTSSGSGWHEEQVAVDVDQLGRWNVDYSTSLETSTGDGFHVDAIQPNAISTYIITATEPVEDNELITISFTVSNTGAIDGTISTILSYAINGQITGPSGYFFEKYNQDINSGDTISETITENIKGSWAVDNKIDIIFEYTIQPDDPGYPEGWLTNKHDTEMKTLSYQDIVDPPVTCFTCIEETAFSKEFPSGTTCGEGVASDYEHSTPPNCETEPLPETEEEGINIFYFYITAIIIAVSLGIIVWRFIL